MALDALIRIKPVQAFLMDGSVMTVFEAILEKFALSKERAVELLDLTDAVLDDQLAVNDIPAMLQQAFGVEEARAIRMACDVVGFRLLPLEEYVPGVVAQLNAWGADMTKYPKSRVGKQKLFPETLAAQIDTTLGLNFSEVLVKRAGFLIMAYWKGEKTKESTLTFFSRAITIGGLGLSPEQSQKVLQAVDESRDLVELVPVTPGEVPPVIEDSGEVALKEIERIEQTMTTHEKENEKEVILAPSHEIAAEVPVISVKKINEESAENWAGELREAEKKAREIQAIAPEASIHVSAPSPVSDHVYRDSSLDLRFAALTKDVPRQHVEEIMPGARVSAARTIEEERERHATAISDKTLADALVASRPAPVTPLLTVGSIPPEKHARPLTDIQPVKRLMGPIDELGALTPTEFRRLSAVPADAVQKIMDMLATLEGQSYEDRVKGIVAWRKSPMNMLYVEMTTAALTQGIAVAEVAAQRRAAGEESLSPAEIRAVSQLNAQLRF